MSEHNQAKQKAESFLGAKSFLSHYFKIVRSLPQKKLLLASCLLHLIFFSLLFMNWHKQEPIKEIFIPENIQARVVSLDELKQIQDRQKAEQKAIQDQLNKEKLIEDQKQQKLKEIADAKRKAKEAEQKKREAEKLLKIKKQKEEQAKLDQEKKLKEQETKKKKEAEEKKAAEERKKAEDAKKQADKKLADEKALELKQQELKMLEKLQQVEQQKALAEQQAKALAIENERKRQEKQFLEYELTEKERYMARIKTQIEGLWRIPPKSHGLRITLSIRLLPNGELAAVTILSSSGNEAFDRSALLAVKSVRRFFVPEDNKVFERNFRQFNMSFSPE